MPVLFPESEEIFQKWLESAEDKLLSKRIKKYVSKTLSIKTSDIIKSSAPTIFALVQIEERPADLKSLEPLETIPLKDLRKKTFWEFSSDIESNDWKGPAHVLKWDSVKPKDCNSCGGNGYNSCTCNKGFLSCSNCKGKYNVKCPNCRGNGKFVDEIDIKSGENNKFRKEKISYNCSTCFGEAKVVCGSCGGSGKEKHGECGGSAKIKCRICKGTGKIVQLIESAVPIKRKIIDFYFTPYFRNKDDEVYIIEILKRIKHQISKYEINDETYLDPDHLEPFISEFSKESEYFLKNLRKEIEDFDKTENKTLNPPIQLFPGYEVSCQTNKGHKFEIIAIGDQKKYVIADIKWKAS